MPMFGHGNRSARSRISTAKLQSGISYFHHFVTTKETEFKKPKTVPKMGGGNAQKSAAARAKNLKDVGRTAEDRKIAAAKIEKDGQAFRCLICMQTFMVNVKPPTLLLHVTAKHPGTEPTMCFASLKGFDPNAPAVAPVVATKAPIKPKKKKTEDSFDLLSAGLKKKGK